METDLIISDYTNGMGLKKLGTKWHMDWTTVKAHLIAHGIQIRDKTKKKLDGDVINLYKSGMSTYDIAEKYSCSAQSVRDNLIRSGVIFRDISERNRNYEIDIARVGDFKTEEGAYWLGFLLADGHVNKKRYRIRVNLNRNDVGHLYALSHDINSTISPKYSIVTLGNKKHERAYLTINNKELVERYRANGFDHFKDGKPNLLTNEINMRHFLRGLWDGDGVVTHNEIYLRMGYCDQYEEVVAWVQKKVIEQVEQCCGVKIPANKISKVKHANAYICWWAGSPAVAIGRTLYTDCMRYLPRKAQKVMKYLVPKLINL